jgi:hypothetical protein
VWAIPVCGKGTSSRQIAANDKLTITTEYMISLWHITLTYHVDKYCNNCLRLTCRRVLLTQYQDVEYPATSSRRPKEPHTKTKMFSFHSIILGLLAAICSFRRGVSACTDITCGGQFPKAGGGFAQRTDGCSSVTENPDQVRDSWGSANFRGVCDEHDRCYYTLRTNVDECNRNFCDGLRNSCRKAYCIKILGETVCPEPLTYGNCLGIAESYCALVRLAAKDFFAKAQGLQERYERCIAENGGVCQPKVCSNGATEGSFWEERVPGTRCEYTIYACRNGRETRVGKHHVIDCIEL